MVRLLLSLQASMRIDPDKGLLGRALPPRRGPSVLLLIMRFLLHPSVSASKSLPIGWARSSSSVQTARARENNRTTGMRTLLISAINKVST